MCHVLLAWTACLAATLGVDHVTAAPGDTGVDLPIAVASAPGDEVAGIQFDLVFDAGTLALPDITLGEAAESAEKFLVSHEIEPGTVRVIIAGLNQLLIPDGTVVHAWFDIGLAALEGTYPVALDAVLLSGPYGGFIDTDTAAGSIEVAGAEGEVGDRVHTADRDADYEINLSELLRVIQFFNAGGYHCQAGTEDGYAPGPGIETCLPHDTDYNAQDWVVSLYELLRLIQFFNSGGYHDCPGSGTEDGYCPGMAAR